MSTIVCQGSQSCSESQLMESRTLRLKLASPSPPPPTPFSQSFEFAFNSCISDSNSQDPTEKCSNPDMGGWSFLQALSNISQKNPPTEAKMEEETENCSYVHPLVKRSLSTLSEKSLELCTENLGSETGSDIIEDSIFSFSSSSSSSSSSDSETGNCSSPKREQEPKLRQFFGAKKANSRSFPPPLTTISGSNSLSVRPHREDGRLIIQAVQAPSTQSCFQADRSHGRLRLSFTANYIADFDLEVTAEEENEGFCEDDEDREVFEEEKEEEGEEEEEEEEEEGEEEEKEESDVCMSGEMDGNNLDVGVKMGMGKFQRPSRCKEGGHGNKEGLLNIEPFWVATS